jgi:hypothetical protein
VVIPWRQALDRSQATAPRDPVRKSEPLAAERERMIYMKPESYWVTDPYWVNKIPELKWGQVKPSLDMFTQGEICTMTQEDIMSVPATIMLSKLLIEALGKEEAGKRMYKLRYDEFHHVGRMSAKSAGFPQDLDTACEISRLKAPPWVQGSQYLYKTPRKVVIRAGKHCFVGEAVKKHADKEMQEFLAEYLCIHDRAWWEGFNPNFKFSHTKHLLKGAAACEFCIELPE